MKNEDKPHSTKRDSLRKDFLSVSRPTSKGTSAISLFHTNYTLIWCFGILRLEKYYNIITGKLGSKLPGFLSRSPANKKKVSHHS